MLNREKNIVSMEKFSVQIPLKKFTQPIFTQFYSNTKIDITKTLKVKQKQLILSFSTAIYIFMRSMICLEHI